MLQLIHEAVDDAVGLVFRHVGEMSINGSSFRRHVAEISLNEPKVDAKLYQMSGVGVPECSHRSTFVDPAFSQSCSEGVLNIGYRSGSDCPGEFVMFAGSTSCREDPVSVAVCLVPVA